MRKIIIAAAALFAITASAHAETYNVEGVTIHVGNGCRSSSCVSVYAPGYGYYHGERSSTRVHKAHKDAARVAAMAKKDDAASPAAAAPAVEAVPAAETAPVKTPDATPQADPQAAPSDASPAK